MDSSSVTKARESRAQTDATRILDARLSAREGYLRDQATEAAYRRRDGRQQTHTQLPAPAQLAGYVRLAQHADRHGTLPSVTRSRSKVGPRIKRAHALHRHGGELAFLRLDLGELDDLPLRASSTVARAKQLVAARLNVLAPGAVAYDVALQRGKHGGTHAHILIPLRFLAPYPRRKAREALAGKGGGVSIGSGLHIVRVADSEQDRAAVAAYMGRDPDGRLDADDSSDLDYLQALEDLLAHRATGDESQLTWSKMPRSWRV